MSIGKRRTGLLKKYDQDNEHEIEAAVTILKSMASAKFDESIELAMNMNLDPTQADQKIRGTVSLPHGIGKKVRVLVFAKGEKEKEAKDAGADFVGAEDLVTRITKDNWLEFDIAIATPDMMKDVGKLGKVLGPRGLMPNPKTGSVTMAIADAVKQFKAGKIEINLDKTGNVHLPLGKASFAENQIKDNLMAALETVQRMRPATTKGVYVKSITVSTTMSPGIRIKTSEMKRFG